MVKASHWGVSFREPPETKRLPPEPDPEQKERDELRRRIAQLEGALPELRLTFAGNQTILRVENQSLDIDSLVNAEMETIRQKYPPVPVPEESPNIPDSKMTQGHLASLSLAELVKRGVGQNERQKALDYNEHLQRFFAQSERVLRKNFETVSKSLQIEVEVQNSGCRPATDVRVKMHFPNGFRLFEKDNCADSFEKMPTAPIHPSVIRESFGLENYRFSIPRISLPKPISIHGPNLSIEESESYDVRWTVGKIRQGDRYPIDAMTVVFDERPFSFAIAFEIVADNAPDIVQGELSVVA
jgi:hypothetical protein